MDYRGPRMSGPPHQAFRQRPGRGNNHYPGPNLHQQHQVPPRLLAHVPMNQQQWAPQYSPQEEAPPAPHYSPQGYPYHTQHTTELPPQTYNSFPQPVYIQPPIYMNPTGQMCYPHTPPPVVSTPPIVTQAMDSAPPRKYHFNSKDNITNCANCNHKNSLAESEFVKRDEEIENLKSQVSILEAENVDLRFRLARLSESLQSERAELHKSVKVEVVENPLKSEMSDETKKQSQLSPEAAEFSPVRAAEVRGVEAAPAVTNEVPVVSAKGVMDEEADVVQCNEAGTQIEENMFDEPSLELTLAPETVDILETCEQTQPSSWCNEVEKQDSPESPPAEKMDDANLPEPAAAEDEWVEDAPLPTGGQTYKHSWQDTSSPPPDHWQLGNRRQNQRGNNRYNRDRQPQGIGRGRSTQNEQDQYNDNSRQNYGPRQGNYNNRSYGNQNNPNFQQSQRNYEENRDNRSRFNDGYQRHEGRVRSGRFNDRGPWQGDHNQKPSDEREDHSRENENSQTNNHRDSHQKNQRPQERPNVRTNDVKDPRESGTQGPQGVWRNDRKDGPKNQNSFNQNQGNLSGKSNPQGSAKTEHLNMLKEMSGDLFTAPSDFSLAHCVGRDFRMGSGIAVRFRTQFRRVGELLDQNVSVGGCAHLQEKERYVFYLVTKELSIGKPKIEDLQESLRAMRAKCLNFGVTKLAMPRIGCGLDKLEWYKVRASINEIFQGTNIEIRIYDWNVENELMEVLHSINV